MEGEQTEQHFAAATEDMHAVEVRASKSKRQAVGLAGEWACVVLPSKK